MEDDEVVQEIDVYLVKELADHLYVVQYPLRTGDNPYVPDDGSVSVEFQWRPIQQQAKMAVERESEDGEKKTVQLISSQMPMKSTYGVCSFEEMDGRVECYITPLMPRKLSSPAGGNSNAEHRKEALQQKGGAVLQMLPDFSHLNAPDVTSGGKSDEGASQLVDTRTKNQKQQVSWELTQSKFVRTYVRLNDFDEAYIPMEYCHANTDRACDMKDRLVPDSLDVKPARTVGRDRYVTSISRDVSMLARPRCVFGGCTVFSMKDMALLPLDEQVLHLFHGAQILLFSTVKELIMTPKPVHDHELVNAIDKVAVLMHGAWVIRTKAWHAMSQGSQTHFKELTLRTWINPADKKQFRNPPKSPASFKAGKLQQCRDLLLMRLYDQEEVLDRDIAELVPDEVGIPYLKAMLEPLCVLAKGDDGSSWRPRLRDSTFAEQFPDHSARSAREWQTERLRLQASVRHEDNERLRMREAHEVPGTAGPAKTAVPAPEPMDVDVKPMTTFPLTELHKRIQALFAEHFVLKLETVALLLGAGDEPAAVSSACSDLATELHGVLVLKGVSLSNASLVDQQHWDAVVAEFKRSRDNGRSSLNRAVRSALGGDYSSRLVGEMLSRIATKKDRITWTLKDGLGER